MSMVCHADLLYKIQKERDHPSYEVKSVQVLFLNLLDSVGIVVYPLTAGRNLRRIFLMQL